MTMSMAALQRMVDGGMTLAQIITETGMDRYGVLRRCEILGVKPRFGKAPYWSDSEREVLAAMAAAGATSPQVARKIGRSNGSVIVHAKRMGIVWVGALKRWTQAEDEKLRQLVDGGASIKQASSAIGRPYFGVRDRARHLCLKVHGGIRHGAA